MTRKELIERLELAVMTSYQLEEWADGNLPFSQIKSRYLKQYIEALEDVARKWFAAYEHTGGWQMGSEPIDVTIKPPGEKE